MLKIKRVKKQDFTRSSVFWARFCFWLRDRLNFDQHKGNYQCRSDLFASWCMIFVYINFDTITDCDMFLAFEWLFYHYEVEIPWDYSRDDDPQEEFESFFVRWREPMCHCLAKFVEIDIDIEDGTFGCDCPHHKRNDLSSNP